ncbi:helix-turn-helix domain-containing protein [Vibrio breoganii]
MTVEFNASVLKKNNRGRKPNLNFDQKMKMYELHEEGFSQVSIAEAFGVSKTTACVSIKEIRELQEASE